MIISRTPYRLSFFGGGTDYPVWYEQHGGAVLSTSIDKYCYISTRYLPPFFEHKSRIVYSKIELVQDRSEIQHPSVRAVLDYLKIDDGIEIHHDGDLPARTGIGSSSSFTVGLLHSLYALKRYMPSKMQLGKDAIYVERDLLKECVGSQDQICAATGGLNRIRFDRNADMSVEPLVISGDRLQHFQSHLMLFFTGFSRFASEVAAKQIENTPNKQDVLHKMQAMVDQGIDILTHNQPLEEFGKLLHESWLLKRSITSEISTPEIDQIYEKALKAGAVGGKVIGAGGGGFMLFFAHPDDQPRILQALNDLLYVPFRFENSGSQIVFYRPESRKTDRYSPFLGL